MAKKNIKQENAQQVAAQQVNNVAAAAEQQQAKAAQSAGKAAAKAAAAQAKADAQHTADLWKIEHAGVNAAIRTLFQVAADDPKTWQRMAYIMGAEQGMPFDDSKAMRDRYKAAIRTKAAFVAEDGTPLYKQQTAAKGIAEYVAAPAAYTAKAVFADPLLVTLGAKQQQQRSAGVYYRDNVVMPAEQAKAAIEQAQAERERLNEVAKKAKAAERDRMAAEKAQAQA
jgi:hypothetical protein